MKGPSIAVMLGGGKPSGDEDEAEASFGETKSRAEDAARAYCAAVKADDAGKMVKAFRALSTLASKLDELEDAGEKDDSDDDSKEKDDSEADEDTGMDSGPEPVADDADK